MPTEKKKEQVQMIADLLSRCTIAIATDYRGLNVTEMNLLRSRLRERGVEFKVIKNRLARLAAEQVGKQSFNAFLEGPTAIAFGYGEITEPARALAEHIRSEKSVLTIKGGLMEAQTLQAEQVKILSTLPPREQLVARVMAAMQAPIYTLQYILSAQLRGLLTVLSARRAQLEGE
ncbi:MAG: 50S ribosomal protein L10 [Dehalococcoidia bacterium]